MSGPKASLPHFPPGYVEHAKALLPWSQVEKKLAEAGNYWLCTVRPDGRPHAIPKWGVWVDGKVYFDGSPETRHARNIAGNPEVIVHLESGAEAVIVEGTCTAAPKPTPELGRRLADAYAAKYAARGYAPKPDSWDNGGLYAVTPRTVFAWTLFTDDPTKFVFEE